MPALVDAAAIVAQFLLEHGDLLGDIEAAIAGGLSKDVLRKAIRDAMVAASDAAMKAELGG